MSNDNTTNIQQPMAPPVGSSDLFGDSTTWPLVLEFAKRMEAKLEKNRHKGNREGWLGDDIDDLLDRLREETVELDTAICIGHVRMNESLNAPFMAQQIADEAADVANFAMMISDWHLARVPKSPND